ncbi:MAG: beta-N-acetylglucosaminidase [Flavobacteriia bacterium]|nr:MAG: beta-N-acetylglucosaminidase [Flavobacteriia bacterium]
MQYPNNYFSKFLFIILIISLSLAGYQQGWAQSSQNSSKQTIDYYTNSTHWVDSIIRNMSVKEKLAQLMMVAAYSNKDAAHEQHILNLVKYYDVGGLIFMQGTPEKQVELTNRYQSHAKIPLLIGFDGEWGLGMRLKNTFSYPWNLTLGAIKDTTLIRAFGERVGEQCRRTGIHINFAPVVDINTNPQNPIIGNRSFGSDADLVINHALAFINGIQSQNVLACAKHFPGHGDTYDDSHKTLPTVGLSYQHLDSIELKPYKILSKKGLKAIMAAHLSVPALEPDPQLPTSLSKNVITKLLKQEIGFDGLVITDALNMKGASNYSESGALELQAFLAGNDILLFPKDVPKALDFMLKAYNDDAFDIFTLDKAVKKVLTAKYQVGLHRHKPIATANLNRDLVNIKDTLLFRKLTNASITALKSTSDLPVVNMNQNIGYVRIGKDKGDVFYKTLKQYKNIDRISVPDAKKTTAYNTVIIGVFKSSANPWKSYKLTPEEVKSIETIARHNNVILTLFTSPYSLLNLNTSGIENIVIGYQNNNAAKSLTAQKIFGGSGFNGKLPVSLPGFSVNYGLIIPSLQRLSYGLPQEVGINPSLSAKIDSTAKAIIDQKMAPGLQILVARNGKVFHQKSYGYFTDKKTHKVSNSNLYDLASMTKILAGLPLMMKAYEEYRYDLDDPLSHIIPEASGTNKDSVTIREALSHMGRLKSWIPYYKSTLDSITGKPSKIYYRQSPQGIFTSRVSDNLYIRRDYQDSIYNKIVQSDLRSRYGYRYSDLFFTLLKKYVEDTYHKPMDELTDSLFYTSLGAGYLTYNPLHKFAKQQVVPTEKDDYFRNRLIQGDVHDMAAAMMGGVSGHAGLFGNANDVAKMMQMYLQKGYYGGKRYFEEKTIQTFNQQYYALDDVRRGLGFDKPQINPKEKATCDCVSRYSFGHSGFTGTYTWADPETGTLYVFLSNRVYPTMRNKKLIKANVRTEIQRMIQEAIVDSTEHL